MIYNIKTYSGLIVDLLPHQIIVFGSNPEGRHGAGTALFALKHHGAKYGIGRGLVGNSYALVTKNLTPYYYEKSTGIEYVKSGFKSVTKEQIVDNIRELYSVASLHSDKEFYIAYTDKGYNLNGYSCIELCEMFILAGDIPDNMYFHEGFAIKLQEIKDVEK